MPRPRGDNPAPAAPTSAPVNQGQPASVPNRAKMATYTTDAPDAANAPPEFDIAARLGNVVPTSNPITGETTNLDATEPPPSPEQPAQPEMPAPTGQPATDAGAVPDKYRGKSAEELIRMHQEAERAMHSRDEEIRVARTYLDRFVTGQPPVTPNQPGPVTNNGQAVAGGDLPADDVKMLEMMLSKPTQFTEALVNKVVNGMRQSSAVAEAQRIFNEHKAEIQTEQFGRFISTVPRHIVDQADRDPQVMQFLLNSYRGHAPANPTPHTNNGSGVTANPVAAVEKQRADAAARAAAARTVAGAAPANQPTFTRMQLMNMMVNEPEKYEALQPQILAAYANGLVGD